MRLWSIHPAYLDAKGLVALWRETLLAQNVLMGKTKGYKFHPQLDRFKEHTSPKAAIGYYLKGVWDEATERGYNFDKKKIRSTRKVKDIKVTKGQLAFEMKHLLAKLKKRDPKKYTLIKKTGKVKTHPIFKSIPGGVADWERA